MSGPETPAGLPPYVPAAPTPPPYAPGAQTPPPYVPGAHPPPYVPPVVNTVPHTELRSDLSDGEWHRLHPLTPLFRGGLFLVVIIGVLIANMRERLIVIFFPDLMPGMGGEDWGSGDPVDWIIENDYLLLGLGAVVVILILLIAWFYVSWRFHTFRITDDDVEVRQGILFRSQRRAPLDRVQGVNLTRPLFARLVGMAKLEVVGAGADSNVKLEYLSTTNAEEVRADILRLASGRRLALARAADGSSARGAQSGAAAVSAAVSSGITGLIVGAEGPVGEPESVVHIPTGRLIMSHILSTATVFLLVLVAAVIVGAAVGTPWVLFSIIPMVLAFGAYWISQIVKSLRYSIAPTPNGLRITFGLFTTVTETLPPGRIHAVDVQQSILWRPAGWWTIKINRITGRATADATTDQFTTVLPVGKREDVERVLRLILPDVPESEWPTIFEQGILRRREEDRRAEDGSDRSDGPDGFTTMPARAWFIRPFSWRRNGFMLTPEAVLMRRGVIWRSLAIFPFARMQSFALHQGPIDRLTRVASARPHTVTGPVTGHLAAIDRDTAIALFEDVSSRISLAASADRTHRWASEDEGAPAAPVLPPPYVASEVGHAHPTTPPPYPSGGDPR